MESIKPKALVTGITGQDGSYMCEILLEKGYEVHGTMRRSSNPNTQRVTETIKSVITHLMDLSDSSSVSKIISQVKPDIIFCLAAQSDVRASYDIPEYTGDVTGLGFTRILEAVRQHCPEAKIYQAGSSEMFGKVQTIPQNEYTPFWPRSPYGCAKVYAFSMGRCYREGYGMKIYNGILFNHESPRRGETFVTRKITRALSRIKLGLQECLYLGNLDSKRDWGHAKDYVEMQWLMLQQDHADDYVIATGQQYSVREFVDCAAKYLDMFVKWQGSGIDEKGYDQQGRCIIAIDKRYFRPTEVDSLLGDATKARKNLQWTPKISFQELVEEMVQADYESAKRDELVKQHGFIPYNYCEFAHE